MCLFCRSASAREVRMSRRVDAFNDSLKMWSKWVTTMWTISGSKVSLRSWSLRTLSWLLWTLSLCLEYSTCLRSLPQVFNPMLFTSHSASHVFRSTMIWKNCSSRVKFWKKTDLCTYLFAWRESTDGFLLAANLNKIHSKKTFISVQCIWRNKQDWSPQTQQANTSQSIISLRTRHLRNLTSTSRPLN